MFFLDVGVVNVFLCMKTLLLIKDKHSDLDLELYNMARIYLSVIAQRRYHNYGHHILDNPHFQTRSWH